MKRTRNCSLETLEKKEDRNNLFILLSFGLVLKLYAFSQIYMIAMDGALQYIPVAKLFYEGEYIRALLQPQLPLYPFLISIFSHITGSFELSGQLISIIFSLMAVFPLYLIGKSLFGPRAAFWASILYLSNPLMLHCSVDVLKEGLLIFLFFSSIFCSLRFLQEKKPIWLIWTIIFVAGGVLVRMNILAVLMLLGVWLGYRSLRKKLIDGKLAYRYFWIFFLIIGIIAAFVIPDVLGWEFFVEKKAYISITRIFRHWFIYEWPSLPQIAKSVLVIVSRFIEKAGALPFLLALFGLWWKAKTREFSIEERYLALLIGVLIFILFPNLYASGRYHLPAIFLLYLWAGFGFVKIRALIDARFTSYRRLTAVIAVMLLLVTILPISLQPQRLDKIGRKEVGLWLREQPPPSPLILTNDPRVAYYAGGEYLLIPHKATSKRIVRVGKMKGADYLVMEGKGTAISDTFSPFEKKGDLQLVHRHPYGHKGRVVYVYKIRRNMKLP